jgi:hypothetical protein
LGPRLLATSRRVRDCTLQHVERQSSRCIDLGCMSTNAAHQTCLLRSLPPSTPRFNSHGHHCRLLLHAQACEGSGAEAAQGATLEEGPAIENPDPSNFDCDPSKWRSQVSPHRLSLAQRITRLSQHSTEPPHLSSWHSVDIVVYPCHLVITVAILTAWMCVVRDA